LIHPCNEDQVDALFLLSLFRQSTSTDSQLKSTTRTNCCIYIVHLLMMGYKYGRNM